MSPDEIRAALAKHYPQLKAERRHNPKGWSFFLGTPRGGTKSNRIIRATRSSANAVTRLKLSVSSRLQSTNVEKQFAAGLSELRQFVDAEIKLLSQCDAER